MNETVLLSDVKPRLLNAAAAAALCCGISTRLWRARTDCGLTPEPIRFGKRNYWHCDEPIAWIDAGCPKRKDWMNFRDRSDSRKCGRNPRNSL